METQIVLILGAVPESVPPSPKTSPVRATRWLLHPERARTRSTRKVTFLPKQTLPTHSLSHLYLKPSGLNLAALPALSSTAPRHSLLPQFRTLSCRSHLRELPATWSSTLLVPMLQHSTLLLLGKLCLRRPRRHSFILATRWVPMSSLIEPGYWQVCFFILGRCR